MYSQFGLAFALPVRDIVKIFCGGGQRGWGAGRGGRGGGRGGRGGPKPHNPSFVWCSGVVVSTGPKYFKVLEDNTGTTTYCLYGVIDTAAFLNRGRRCVIKGDAVLVGKVGKRVVVVSGPNHQPFPPLKPEVTTVAKLKVDDHPKEMEHDGVAGKSNDEIESANSNSTNYKQKKEQELKKSAGSSHNWNTLFLGANAVAEVLAKTYGKSKEEVLGSSDGSKNSTKIMVRNIPFQANQNEVRDIFKVFGEIKALRLPKKMVPGAESHRGFGFVDYCNKNDAKNAFEALQHSTHLYGRRLVLEWADSDENIDVIRKRTADQFHGSEAKKRKLN